MTHLIRISLAGAALVAGAVQAQSRDDGVIVGRLGGGAETRVVEQHDAHSFQITIENGRPRVVIDGEEVPADRVETEGGRIVVVTPDGERRVTGLRLRDPFRGDLSLVAPGTAFGADAIVVAEPKVVIGVTTRATLPALEKHLRLEPGATTMVASVLEGLPAHAAGLEPDDVIVSVDDESPVPPARLRELLAGREPGERVVLRVIHEGREREIGISVERYDAERMATARRIGEPDVVTEVPGLNGQFVLPDMPGGLWQQMIVDGDQNAFFVPRRLDATIQAVPAPAPRERSADEVRAMEQRLRELEERLKALDRLLEKLDAADAARHGG